MKVSGFTFIRNAIKFDYPIVEAITSILPLCDEFVVAVGQSDDETEALIKAIKSPKIKILPTVWDDSLREGGRVLADETNKALRALSPDSDWAFYIQGDEVVHEDYLPAIKQGMERWVNDQKVEGLLFNYRHFYGSYDFIGDSRKWYRKEVRIIRNLPGMSSYKDAQGFRYQDRPLRVKPIEAWVHHYGWVKPPSIQQEKQKHFNKLWHDDNWMEKRIAKVDEFDYSQVDSLAPFTGTHPKVMLERLERINWKFDHDPTIKNLSVKKRLLHTIEKISGWRIGEYKNYRLLR